MGVESVNSILNNQFKSKLINSNSILNIHRNKSKYSEIQARSRAQYLADKFENQGGLMFYTKVAWNLSDQYIDWLVDYSLKKKNPTNYFVKVASMKMKG